MEDQRRDHLLALMQIHQKRLNILELQVATFGIQAPPHIVIEIEDIQEKIKDIEIQLHTTEMSQIHRNQRVKDLDVEALESIDFQKICIICYDYFDPIYTSLESTTDKVILVKLIRQYTHQTGQINKINQLLS